MIIYITLKTTTDTDEAVVYLAEAGVTNIMADTDTKVLMGEIDSSKLEYLQSLDFVHTVWCAGCKLT